MSWDWLMKIESTINFSEIYVTEAPLFFDVAKTTLLYFYDETP